MLLKADSISEIVSIFSTSTGSTLLFKNSLGSGFASVFSLVLFNALFIENVYTFLFI